MAKSKRRIRIIPRYFRESWREIKKVTWPSRKETIRLTFAVLLFTALFTIFTAVADVGLEYLFERIFL